MLFYIKSKVLKLLLHISGRDASRAYVSGDFTEAGLIDDVSGLSSTDYIGLDEWVKFYNTDYKYVGKYLVQEKINSQHFRYTKEIMFHYYAFQST